MSEQTLTLLSILPPVLERYELKYVIPASLVEPISDYLQPYCDLDHHSKGQPQGFYPVNSLYFDTPSHRFLKLRMNGADRRFNMRVRSYGLTGRGPFFAEIKFRTPGSVKKFRATIAKEHWPSFLKFGSALEQRELEQRELEQRELEQKEATSRDLFLRLAESYAIEPKIFTCYRRRAFASHMDDYARVTFDIDMRYRSQDIVTSSNPFNLVPDGDCINYDAETIYGDEVRYGENVVLELKANIGAIPLWMMELIRRFQLKRVGFSKYLNSSLADHRDNGTYYMPGDRQACSRIQPGL